MIFSPSRLDIALITLILLFGLFLFPLSTHAATPPLINEYLPHPSSGNKEWIEIYNPDHIDLTGYFIDDDTSFTDDAGSSPIKHLSAIVQGQTDILYVFETTSFLNNDGDIVALFDPSGTIVDSTSFSDDPGPEVSVGRYPDGSGSFSILQSATKGDPNSPPFIPTSTPVPTEIPTATSKPTPTLRPTHTPVPTKVPPTPTRETKSLLSTTPEEAFVLAEMDYASSASPSAASTQSALLTETPTPRPSQILTQGSRKKNKNAFVFWFLTLGGVCLIGCGILVLWIQRRNA